MLIVAREGLSLGRISGGPRSSTAESYYELFDR